MQILEKLLFNFKEIEKANFEEEQKFTFLRIYTNIRDLKEITILSHKINKFLDENYKTEKKYFLDILSKGIEENIEVNNLKNYIDKNIYVLVKKPIQKKESFEGTLLKIEKDLFLIKWNDKGQFKKQEIKFENVKNIKLSIKVKKRS